MDTEDLSESERDKPLPLELFDGWTWYSGDDGMLAYIVPAIPGGDWDVGFGQFYHLAVLDGLAGTITTTKRPVARPWVRGFLERSGFDPDAVEWRPNDEYPPAAVNPFTVGKWAEPHPNKDSHR